MTPVGAKWPGPPDKILSMRSKWAASPWWGPAGSAIGLVGLGLPVLISLDLWARLSLFALFAVSMALALVITLRQIRKPASVPRAELTTMGRQAISGAHSSVVLFGGDMSWAIDYAESIREARRAGRVVSVIFPRNEGELVVHNRHLLETAGAVCIPTSTDFRGILVDGDQDDAYFWMAERRLRKGARGVGDGPQGTDAQYEYASMVYRKPSDLVLIRTIDRICHSLGVAQ